MGTSGACADYGHESFCVRHACFLEGKDPYGQLKRTLKAEIDEEAWVTVFPVECRCAFLTLREQYFRHAFGDQPGEFAAGLAGDPPQAAGRLQLVPQRRVAFQLEELKRQLSGGRSAPPGPREMSR